MELGSSEDDLENGTERLSTFNEVRVFVAGSRLAHIPNDHLYNLCKSQTYQRRRTVWTRTRLSAVAIGERRKPRPDGRPGPAVRRHRPRLTGPGGCSTQTTASLRDTSLCGARTPLRRCFRRRRATPEAEQSRRHAPTAVLWVVTGVGVGDFVPSSPLLLYDARPCMYVLACTATVWTFLPWTPPSAKPPWGRAACCVCWRAISALHRCWRIRPKK